MKLERKEKLKKINKKLINASYKKHEYGYKEKYKLRKHLLGTEFIRDCLVEGHLTWEQIKLATCVSNALDYRELQDFLKQESNRKYIFWFITCSNHEAVEALLTNYYDRCLFNLGPLDWEQLKEANEKDFARWEKEQASYEAEQGVKSQYC